jgi:hypothetical protein
MTKPSIIAQPADTSRDQWVAILKRDYKVYAATVEWSRKTKCRRSFAFQCERDIKATLRALNESVEG